jgi:hypothetical protein
VLVHLLLTNYPQLPDLASFGENPASMAASLDGAEYMTFVEVSEMSEGNEGTREAAALELSEEDREGMAELKALKAEGLTLQCLLEREAKVRSQGRNLEVQSIVAALEGKGQREDVVQVDGSRHYPAVVRAVKWVLRDERLAIEIGQEGKCETDQVVVAVVNALPKEARMVLDQAPGRPDQGLDTGAEESMPAERGERPPNVRMPTGVTPREKSLEEFDRRLGG